MPGKGQKAISAKIRLLRREGKSAAQAAGQAFGMARHGDLGSAAKAAAGKRKRHKATTRTRSTR